MLRSSLPYLCSALVLVSLVPFLSPSHPHHPLGAPVGAPPIASRPAPLPVPLRLSASTAMTRAGAAWRLGRGGGTLTFALPSGQVFRTVSIAGRLSGPATVQIAVHRRGGWQAVSQEEPGTRDDLHDFAAGPITVDSPAFALRLSVMPDAPGTAAVLVRDLRVLGLGTPGVAVPTTGAAAATGQAGRVPSSRPSYLPGLAAASDDAGVSGIRIARMLLAPAADSPLPGVISRLAWGCPDGEASPQWVPFYQQPFHIIIHHTGSPSGPDGPIGDVQGIWSFHTFTRNWGDIGYQYVIDPEGRTYEGRAGGDLVAGAHTHDFNLGSIGIALIGDYNAEVPPAPMIQALQRLVTSLANRYGIDPRGVQSEQGTTFFDLAGHRDFNQTDCPGDNVYSLLPGLRALIARDVRSGAALDGTGAINVTAGEASVGLLRILNTGTTTWNSRFSLVRQSGALPGLPGGYNLSTVAPGGTLTIPLFLPTLRAGSVYTSRWRLLDAAGIAAGAPFTLIVRALAPGQPTPTPPPTPLATAIPVPTVTAIHRAHATAAPTHGRRPSRTPTPLPRRTRSRATPTATPTMRPATSRATPRQSATPAPTFTAISTSTRPPADTETPSPTPTRTPRPSATPTLLVVPTVPLGGTSFGVLTSDSYDIARISSARMAPLTGAKEDRGRMAAHGATAVAGILSRSMGVGRTEKPRHFMPGSGSCPRGAASGGLQAAPGRHQGGLNPASSRRGHDVLPAVNGGVSRAATARAETPGSAAAPGASTIWYFAEGSSAHSEREELAFLNPGSRPAYVVATLVRADGHHVYAVADVPPRGRGTLEAGDAAGLGTLLGAVVRSSMPIYAERTIYHSSQIEEGTGAALTPGIVAPSPRWYLPHPRTRADEHEQIAILNPGSAPVAVAAALVQHGALRPWRHLEVPPLAVRGLEVPGGAASALITATGTGVVAEERTIYAGSRGYTVHSGLTTLRTDGYLLVPAADGGQGAIMLMNPGSAAAHVTVSGPGILGALHTTVRAGGESLLRLAGLQAAGLVYVRAGRPIAASFLGYLQAGGERSLARDYRGSAASTLAEPALVHAFAEGDTRLTLSDPREIVLLANPGDSAAHVQITMLATGGRTARQTLTLPAGSAISQLINGFGPPSQHGLLVTADRPVLALRAIDFNEGVDEILSPGLTP